MEQRIAEWFAARKKRVTGSVAGAILGDAPYMTRADVMRSMVRAAHNAESEFTGNVATEYGTFHEDGAIYEYELETGNTVQSCGFFAFEDWLGASPDGLLGDDGVIEVKCPYGKRNSGDFGEIAPHYYAQVQIEMYCTGRSYCHFYQWSSVGTRLDTIDYNPEWIAENLPVLRAFYDEFLKELDNPAHLEPLRREVYGPKASALLAEYDDLTDAIERATERKKEVLADIIKAAGERNAILNGRNLTLVEREGSVSYAKAIKALAPDADLEQWRGKPTSYWRLG